MAGPRAAGPVPRLLAPLVAEVRGGWGAQAMKAEAEAQKLPPIYRGKWATASEEEVQAMKDSGAPYCYRFRVPKVGDGAAGAAASITSHALRMCTLALNILMFSNSQHSNEFVYK